MQMILVLFSLVVIFLILVVSEYLWRRKKLVDEQLRKFVHVFVGVFVASWPWFMSWRTIQLVSIALLLVVFISRKYKLFHALLSVKRKTHGDYAFALAIGICALLTTSEAVFAVAMLHMAVADGLAAIIGRKFGHNWRYKIAGQEKTIIGSMAFWTISVCILGVGLLFSGTTLDYASYVRALIIVPPVLTIVENIINHGYDNLAIPVACVLLLNIV